MPRLQATQAESTDSDGVQIEDLDAYDVDGSFEDIDDADFDLLDLDHVHQMVDDLTWKMLQIDAPDWYINPAYRLVFSERSAYDSIAACSPLTFPPDMDAVLTSPTPPKLAWFKALPQHTGKM
jgi:hypothetical protein